MGLHKILKIVAAILAIAGIIFYVMIVSKGDLAIEAAYADGEDVASINWALYIGYAILGVVLLFVLTFVLKGIFAGDIKKTLMSVGAFLVIIVISYVMASSSIEGLPLNDGVAITESGSKWVGTGLYVFYILAVIAIGSMVFSGIKKLTK